jgi:hypothetical protein
MYWIGRFRPIGPLRPISQNKRNLIVYLCLRHDN